MNRTRLLLILLFLITCFVLPTPSVFAKKKTATFVVEVADIGKSADLLKVLKDKGIQAVLFPKNTQVINEQSNQAVWIGRNVPLSIVKTTLLEAMKIYPHLRYFHLVGDRGEVPPEKVHNTIHIGGSSDAAIAMELRAFDQAEITKTTVSVKTIEELHRYLHEMNRVPAPPAKPKSVPH